MAIGDTVQAGLGRMDFSAFQRAGEAQARANQAFGDAIGGVVEKYYQKKQEKQEREQRERAYREAGLNAEEAKAASGDKELGGLLINKMVADRNYQLRKEEFDRQRAMLDEQNAFIDTLYSESPTGELNKAGEQEVENFKAFAAPEDPRINPFIEQTLQNPQFQETAPVMSLTGNRFMEQFKTPGSRRLAYNYLQSRQKDAPTISRVVNMEDGQGGFVQVGVDNAGNPIRSFGPPKPSGMYRTPEEARKEEILVGRTKDAMESVKSYVEGSNLAIKQAEQANLALRNLPDTTGGITSFVNDMKVLAESVGIDLPEEYTKDMKDIGVFRQLTGQFLFNAMSNTKGSITEREMGLFRQISPDIDNSKAANKAMLELYVKAGERAKGRRKLIRELQKKDVDPREIERAIEKFDEENSLIDDIQALAPQSEQQTFRIGQKQVEGEVVGKKPDGSLIVKTKDGKIFVQPAQ